MIDLSRVLVTGADGMIGRYIDFGVRTDRNDLDILDREALARRVNEIQPQAIIHLAAATDMDRCEKDPQYAVMMNAVGTYNVALAARAVGATFIYVSTSGIFDGAKDASYIETDIPNPQNAYAHSKYMGELIVQSMLTNFLIVRTCWIFGGGPEHDRKFIGAIMKKLSDAEIPGLDDVRGSPTYAKDFVAGLVALMQSGKHGIFHLVNDGVATRFDVAKYVVEKSKSRANVFPVQGDYFELAAERLKNESMISSSGMRPWREALAEYLEGEWKLSHSHGTNV